MEAVGVTIEVISLLVEVLKFYRNCKDASDLLKTSLQRSIRDVKILKSWVYVFRPERFESLDQNPDLKVLCEPLPATLEALAEALTLHRRELIKWMKKIGVQPPSDINDSRPLSLQTLHAKRSSNPIMATVHRITFVVVGGKDTLNSLEKAVTDSQREVFGLFLAIFVFTTSKSFQPITDAPNDPPAFSFVVAAQRRQRTQSPVNIISEGEWINSYTKSRSVVDENVPPSRQIRLYTVTPKPGSNKLKAGTYICYDRSGEDSVESINLARLFAADGESNSSSNQLGAFRGDGDMLRCSAVVQPASNLYLQYIFKVPQESSKIRTLRTLLLDKRACPDGETVPVHTIADRVQFSIRLATSVLVVHSLGIVHKRIHPESILVIDTAGSKAFPETLGYPYLVGFHLSRSESAGTMLQQDEQELARHGIYFHPREQAKERTEPYRMISDIYSLGVCLLEIALWRSLFIKDDVQKDYVQDSTARFEKLVNSNYGTERSREDIAYAKMDELIQIAKAEIPRTMGNTFAKVVVDCLLTGSPDGPGPFADWVDPTSDAKPAQAHKYVSVGYLDLVLKRLRAVYDGVSGGH